MGNSKDIGGYHGGQRCLALDSVDTRAIRCFFFFFEDRPDALRVARRVHDFSLSTVESAEATNRLSLHVVALGKLLGRHYEGQALVGRKKTAITGQANVPNAGDMGRCRYELMN